MSVEMEIDMNMDGVGDGVEVEVVANGRRRAAV